MRPLLLIVEDESILRMVLTDIFTDEGYRVRTAGDGEEALAIAEREPPDVILSDVMMPRLDGISLVQRLRDRGITARVVLTSGRHADVNLPGVRFLVKPVDLDVIAAAVAESLAAG